MFNCLMTYLFDNLPETRRLLPSGISKISMKIEKSLGLCGQWKSDSDSQFFLAPKPKCQQIPEGLL